jgi:modification methylase
MNKIFNKSSLNMEELQDETVELVVTSPPYNVGKSYTTYSDRLALDQYTVFLKDVFTECHRVLVDGGRIAVNVANVGRKPYIPLSVLITQILLDIGFTMRGDIIWQKGASAGSSAAFGSWKSPSNPSLRDSHEYILVFSKGSPKLKSPQTHAQPDITRDEFLSWTKSVWEFPTESAKRGKHPAPFPLELPRRLIKLYSYIGQTVLDPFNGSGTTCVAAKELGRHYIGYDIDAGYVALAESRLASVSSGAV